MTEFYTHVISPHVSAEFHDLNLDGWFYGTTQSWGQPRFTQEFLYVHRNREAAEDVRAQLQSIAGRGVLPQCA